MNSVGDRGSVFIEKRGSREEEHEPITSSPPGASGRGGTGVGGPPSPLSSLDP